MKLTYAFCTYNRAERLPALVAAMRAQSCPIPFEILAVNNNSRDDTLDVLGPLVAASDVQLRIVTELNQGIVPARNRAIQESLGSNIMVFVDDDELPAPGLLAAVCDAMLRENAQCVGGRIAVNFTPHKRPRWLGDELLGFLAEVNHGKDPFWIKDDRSPIWTSNIAYDMRLFRDDPTLRFDPNFNRQGADVGGGEDGMMFRALLDRGTRIRYRPDMAVEHFVEPWRLKWRYFLRLHYKAGWRYGRFLVPTYDKTILGTPPFLIAQLLRQCGRTLALVGQAGLVRQAMNAAHALGTLIGYRSRG